MSNFLIDLNDLENNPTTRVPVCLCLDTSGSMSRVVRGNVENTGETCFVDGKTWNVVKGGITAIKDLNDGVHSFFDAILSDEVAMYSAEVCIITFGGNGPKVISDFKTADQQDLSFSLSANGDTYLGEAVNMALDKLEKRKEEYRNKGVDYFQPWLVIITDGEPNGSPAELEKAITRTQNMVNNRKLTLFPLGVGPEADMSTLAKFSPKRTPIKIKETKYNEFFEWLSQSVVSTSQSMPGEKIKLDISKMEGWGEL